MIELFYDSYPIAYFAVSMDMGSKLMMEFLDELFKYEFEFLHPEYKRNRKKFIMDTLNWAGYLMDKEALDKEFPVIDKEFKALGKRFTMDDRLSEYRNVDLFFMMLRLRLIYDDGRDYIRMKLRTLLSHYGYKRRSEAITSHIRDCLMFYHIQTYLKGEQECDIKDISLDDMITFRLL